MSDNKTNLLKECTDAFLIVFLPQPVNSDCKIITEACYIGRLLSGNLWVSCNLFTFFHVPLALNCDWRACICRAGAAYYEKEDAENEQSMYNALMVQNVHTDFELYIKFFLPYLPPSFNFSFVWCCICFSNASHTLKAVSLMEEWQPVLADILSSGCDQNLPLVIPNFKLLGTLSFI